MKDKQILKQFVLSIFAHFSLCLNECPAQGAGVDVNKLCLIAAPALLTRSNWAGSGLGLIS